MAQAVPARYLPCDNTTNYYWPQYLRQSLGSYHVSSPHLEKIPQAAHIDFYPNATIYEARRDKRLHEGGLTTALPLGWPEHLAGPLVWQGSDFATDKDYVVHLCDDDRAELLSALREVKDKNLPFDDITAETFTLPALGRKLQGICETIYKGSGFVILRGFDVDKCSAEDCLRVFLGVTSYIAACRAPQDQLGNVLKHLVDYGRIDSNRDLPVHTDMTADVVATMALKCSDIGGDGTVASVWTVYNELAATRPDLIHVLAEPNWPFDTYGREPAYYNRALMYYHDDKVMVNFSRRVLTGHPISGRSNNIPGLTEAQAEALDAVHFIARKHKLSMSTQRGDMRFINNFAILHGREAYSDVHLAANTDEASQRLSQRHLLRLWLHSEEMAWRLPPALQLVWARGFADPERRRTWDEAHSLCAGARGPDPDPDPDPNPRPGGPQPAYPCD